MHATVSPFYNRLSNTNSKLAERYDQNSNSSIITNNTNNKKGLMSSANESYGLEGCGRVIPFHWPMGSVSFSHDFYRPLQRAAQTSVKQNYLKLN